MPGAAEQYHAIQTSTLQEGRVPPMDFFIRREEDEEPILFLSRSLSYDRRVAKNLSKSEVKELLIQDSDYKTFDRYLNSNIASIIRDPNIPILSRCSLTYDLSLDLMKQVYESADPIAVVKSSNGVLQNVIEVIFADSEAAHNFITLTSEDYELYSHSINVCLYGMALARIALDISKEEALHRFGPGLLLHDIGKLSISHDILFKPDSLTEEEERIVRAHPRNGLKTVEEIMNISEETRSMILHHHERLDGSGYPDGLRGKEISIPARICAIADVFDALSTNRAFQDRKNSFEAFNDIKEKEIPHRLDETYFKQFVKLFLPKTTA